MIKAKDYNNNPSGIYYLSVIDVDMERKEVFCDILTPCTLKSLGHGYYEAEYKSKSGKDEDYITYQSNLFFTLEEAVKHHNRVIKRCLSGLDKFIDDLKNRLI